MAQNCPYKELNYPEKINHFDRLAVQIEETFRELIDQLISRKGHLLKKVLQLKEDFYDKESARVAALDELEKTQIHLEQLSLKVNMNLPIHKEAALVYQKAKHQLTAPVQLPNLSFSCPNFSRLRLRISQFGEVVENILPLMRVSGHNEKGAMQEQREITQTEYKLPYPYVTAEEVKRRKKEQRFQKERETYSAVPLPTNKDSSNDQRVTDQIEDISEKTDFMSLKSIFSDFRRDEDIVMRTGLPQPVPPQDSGSESSPEPSIVEPSDSTAKPKGVNKVLPVWSPHPDLIMTTVINRSSSVKDYRHSALVRPHSYESPSEIMPIYESVRTGARVPYKKGNMPEYETIRDARKRK